MAFLDNSGDIILDAVLTDTGRYRLAKGDGSFRIAKFALGDDEIDYALHNTSDSRGNNFVDLDILSTPILEAFTDNASGLRSKLISIPRNDLLYLPILKLFQTPQDAKPTSDLGLYCISANELTDNLFLKNTTGIFPSINDSAAFSTEIILDQGLDTTAISYRSTIDSDLKETQYIIEMDSRLGMIKDVDNMQLKESFIDDDRIASYYLSRTNNNTFISDISDGSETGTNSSISGPRGTRLKFRIQPSIDLQYSDFLFQQIGTSGPLTINEVTEELKYIDTNVRITGATTGFRLDVPVRFIKK